ncbi:hypothetical protein ACTU45_02300 [Streptomyces sp. 24-1644]|uniref:hypothetical protein n=1 Tax=Streptomyces sp. 24-1644 TaxID=3457315 RepID=UPI003FA6C18B
MATKAVCGTSMALRTRALMAGQPPRRTNPPRNRSVRGTLLRQPAQSARLVSASGYSRPT